jgi:cytochrome c oxidase subunit II
MMGPQYRRSNRALAAIVGAGLLAFALGALAERAVSGSGEHIVKITAERYDYEPEHIILKRGEPVTLELTAEDRMHGFHVKALGVRADVLAGQSVRVRVVPDKVGTFPFTCDVFCGSGHGDMSGTITVVP